MLVVDTILDSETEEELKEEAKEEVNEELDEESYGIEDYEIDNDNIETENNS